jgi:hypothetical protein
MTEREPGSERDPMPEREPRSEREPMNDRERALAEIAAIAERHGLTADDVHAAILGPSRATAAPARSSRTGPLARALAYLGGTFVLAGIVVFIGTLWQGMNSAERIVVTLGSGLAAFVLAFLAHGSPKRERLTTPLFLLASLLEPAGMLVAFDELGHGGSIEDAEIVVGLVMLVQSVLFLAKTKRTAAVFAEYPTSSTARISCEVSERLALPRRT